MNLLQTIKTNKLFQDIGLNISDDNTSFISTINNKQSKKTVVYGKKNNEEALARELFMLSNKRIRPFLNDYILEHTFNNGKRADAVRINKDILFEVTEYKTYNALKANLNKNIEDAFNQIKLNYIEPVILNDGEYNNTKQVQCCVIVLDIEKLIKNPALFDIYNNITDLDIKKNPQKVLSSYGIYIETRIYDKKSENFGKFTDQSSYEIPVTEVFFKSNNDFDLGFKRLALDANKTITSTGSMGVSNVRERLNPIDSKPKKELLLNMLETLIKGYIVNDQRVLNKNSETKTYIALKQDTTTHFIDNNLFISSTNSALINGQQSTHVPFLLDFYLNPKKELDSEELKIQKSLLDKLKLYTIDTDSKIDSFLAFIQNCSFNYQLELCETEDEIKDMAINRNTSISMNKSDTIFAGHIGTKYKYLSNLYQEKFSLLYIYPNISKSFSDLPESKADIRIIPAIISFVLAPKKKNDLDIFSLARKIDFNKMFEKDAEKYINTLVVSSGRTKTKKEVSIQNDINELKNDIKTLNKFKNDILDYQEKIENLQQQLNDKINQLDEFKDMNATFYQLHSQIPILTHQKILYIYEEIWKEYNQLDSTLKKILDLHDKKAVNMVLVLLKHNSDILKLKNPSNLIKKIFNNIIKLKSTYNFDWISDIGNNKQSDALKDIMIGDISAMNLISKMVKV
jgi:hypothetical protein